MSRGTKHQKETNS